MVENELAKVILHPDLETRKEFEKGEIDPRELPGYVASDKNTWGVVLVGTRPLNRLETLALISRLSFVLLEWENHNSLRE